MLSMEPDVEPESFRPVELSTASGSLDDINVNPRHDGIHFVAPAARQQPPTPQNRETPGTTQNGDGAAVEGHVHVMETRVQPLRSTSNDIDTRGICFNGKVGDVTINNYCCGCRDERHTFGRTGPDQDDHHRRRRRSCDSGYTSQASSRRSTDTSWYDSQPDTALPSSDSTLRRRRGSRIRPSRSRGAVDEETSLKRIAPSGQTFRLLLVGNIGAGKSTTGNTLLGYTHFTTSFGQDAETAECQFASAHHDGNTFEVMDLPGVFDNNLSSDRVAAEIFRAMFCMNPGPNAVLYVVPIGRYKNEDFEAYKRLKHYLGEEVTKHMIIVFTYGDLLTKWKTSIEKYLEKASKNFETVLEECGHRYVVFDNTDDNTEPQRQVERLLQTVGEMSAENGVDHFHSDLTAGIQKFMTAIVSEMVSEGDSHTEYSFAQFMEHVEGLLRVPGLEVNQEETLQKIRSMETLFKEAFATLRRARDGVVITDGHEVNRNLDHLDIETNNQENSTTSRDEWLLEQYVRERVRREEAEAQLREHGLLAEIVHPPAADEDEANLGWFQKICRFIKEIARDVERFFKAFFATGVFTDIARFFGSIIEAVRIFCRYII